MNIVVYNALWIARVCSSRVFGGCATQYVVYNMWCDDAAMI